MAKRRKARKWFLPLLFIALVGSFVAWMSNSLRPLAAKGEGHKQYLRFEDGGQLPAILSDLQTQHLVRNAFATRILATLERRSMKVLPGTYSLSSAMSGEEILRELRSPVKLILRLPETNWAKRTAHLLANYQVVDADEYMRLVHDPQSFAKDVDFPLPKDSLEGYLYPKKYDLPPLIGARRVILKQLQEFQKVVWDGEERPKDLQRTLTLASLVQLESGADSDRAMIAGVIENRIKKKMPLQIDSTILYGLQKWRRLTFKDYREVKSPYNTYKFKGLPPGPICSPDEKDILAAMHPAKHDYLYYVALPNGHSLFAATYKEHLKNISIRKAAVALIKGLKI